MNEEKVTYFAETDARNKRIKFGIKAKDRTRHVYVIGKTGMGKSTLLENMAVQDIAGGDGMAFIDPHGKTADLLMEYVPKERIRDVIYIAPFDIEHPISFNVLESVAPEKRHLVVSGLMSTFKKIWVDAWSARMEYILTNTLLALLEYPGSTLLGVNKMLSDKEYRKEVVSKITDPSVKSFWTKEFANYTERMAQEAVPAIQNKVGQFTANPLIRNMIGQPVSSFDFREAMDRRKIIIINLSKGKIGDENMKLLGGLLVTKIYLAAMSRADVPDRVLKMLPNFYLFVDEFQNFANASFADILSEARKYKLNLTIAHQYVEQMDELVRAAVFGNVGTMIAFRVGATDAELLEKEFAPQFTVEDLVNLGFAQIYLKLMIDGLTSAPFSAVTLPPIPHPESSFVQEIIAASREQFAKPRAKVEVDIIKFHEPAPRPVQPIKPTFSNPPAAGSVGAAPQPAPPRPPMQQAPGNGEHAAKAATPVAPAAQPASGGVPPLRSSAVSPKSQTESFHPESQKQQNNNVHKPFANLKDLLNKVQSENKPVPQMRTPPPGPTPPKEPQPAKSVPLSALNQKNNARPDPKVPTAQNVSDLKNALASVLAAKTPGSVQAGPQGVVPPKTAGEPASLGARPPVNAVPAEAPGVEPVAKAPVPPVPPVPPASAPQAAKSESQDAPAKSVKEVPEDVLKKVLKVD